MQSIHTKLGEGGRVIIPAQIRHALNLKRCKGSFVITKSLAEHMRR